MTDATDHVINPSALREARDKYRPHLEFREKAAIYALYHHRSVATSVLSRAFGVHRLTIRNIVDEDPNHYADIAAKAHELGMPAFYARYVTEADIDALNSGSALKREAGRDEQR